MNDEMKLHLQELVEDVIMNNMMVNNNEYELVYLNKELLDIEDFMEILVNNDLRTFLNIEVRYDESYSSIKSSLKLMAQVYGIKFTNAYVVKCFRGIQKIMVDLFLSPDPEESPIIPTYEQVMADIENLYRINYLYIKLCKIVNAEVKIERIYWSDDEKDKPRNINDLPVGERKEIELEAHDEETDEVVDSMVITGSHMQIQTFLNKMEQGRL